MPQARMNDADFDSKNGTPGGQPEEDWEQHDAASGGTLQARVRELLQKHPGLTLVSARIKALAEYGFADAKIASVLDIAEQTVYNHASRVRKIAGVGRRVPFRMVLFQTPSRYPDPSPNDENNKS